MKSSLPSVDLCPECKTRLENYGQPAINIVSTACHFTRQGIPVFMDTDDDVTWKQLAPVVAYLEGKQYLVTTEVDHSVISLRPTQGYCWCKK